MKRPVIKPFSKDRFQLVYEYSYKNITIPSGYKTNGANIPRAFWSIFPPHSPEYLSAVIVHDYLCDKEEYKKADLIFKEMLKELKVPRWKILIFYISVRIYHKLKYKE